MYLNFRAKNLDFDFNIVNLKNGQKFEFCPSVFTFLNRIESRKKKFSKARYARIFLFSIIHNELQK